MKCRKFASIALCLLHLSMIYISCGDSNISTPNQGENCNTLIASVSNKAVDQKPIDPESIILNHPGLLHNEILRHFNKNNILVSGQKLAMEDIVARMVEACNKTFMKYRIEHSVTEADIVFAVQCLETWREGDIFDIYAPISEQNIESVYNLLDHLAHETGNFELEELENVKLAFKNVEAVGLSNCDSGVIRDITSQYKSNNKSSASYRALDVLENSFDFWSQLGLSAEEIEYEQVSTAVYVQDPKLKIDPLVIGVILADAIGALLCWNGGPLSIICAAFASIAYYILMGSRP